MLIALKSDSGLCSIAVIMLFMIGGRMRGRLSFDFMDGEPAGALTTDPVTISLMVTADAELW